MKQDYICAIPLFGTRVAPRCMYSVTMLVAGVRGNEISFRRSVSTEELDEYRWLEQLLDLEIDIIVCGGISPHINKLLGDYGIEVISNVAGEAQEVLSALVRGELHPWFGYYGPQAGEKGPSVAAGGILAEPVKTAGESCRSFNGCRRWQEAEKDENENAGGSLVARMDYSLLGKIDDFGEVARSQELGRVGLVYCAELLGYAGRVNEILKDKVSTCMLVCPARCSGGLPQGDVSKDMPCRPSEQAENIDKAGCDFVMIIGHCPAFQAVLPERVRAVSAVLFPGKLETAASKTGFGA